MRARARQAGLGAIEEAPEPSMAGEDFSFYAGGAVAGGGDAASEGAAAAGGDGAAEGDVGQTGPHTVFAWLGVRNASEGATHALHSPLFRLDEAALLRGVQMHIAFAQHALLQLWQGGDGSASCAADGGGAATSSPQDSCSTG